MGLPLKSDKKTGKCPMCTRSHPLYRWETFKSKPVDERYEFIKRNRICFNCNNSVEHSSRSCKSSVRCQKPECGKRHHTLLAELWHAKRACGAPWVSKSTHRRKCGNHVTIHRPQPARPFAPQENQCSIGTPVQSHTF